jgi:type I restriction enzyme, S subunit
MSRGPVGETSKVDPESAQDGPYELPEGWAWTRLGDVVSVGSSQVLPKRDPEQRFNYLALEHVESGTGRIINFSPMLGRDIRSNKFTFKAGDVLYGKLRPYLRKATVAEFEGVSATDLIPLRSLGLVEPVYLQRYLLSQQALNYVHPIMAGIKMPRLRSRDLHAFPIPLAPLREQRRIAAKIEALFEESRTARQALDGIPPLLKKFRQSVLAAAFRGDLTRDWREQRPDVEPASVLLERIRTDLSAKGRDLRKARYEEPKGVDTHGLPDLPEGWTWARFGEVVSSMKNGIYKPANVYGDGVPCLRMYNIEDGKIAWKEIKLMRLGAAEIDGYRLLPGDILLNRVNSRELVGKAAVIPKGLGDLVFESKNIRVRVRSGLIEPHYLSYYLLTDQCRRQIELGSKQTVGMATVSQSDIASWLFPFAPLAEQRCIVTRIDALLTQADTIEAGVAAVRRRAEKLEQSILARAFRGELVPQDPDDEPASVLLHRIRAERVIGRG